MAVVDQTGENIAAAANIHEGDQLTGASVARALISVTSYFGLKNRAVAKPIANAPITKPHEADA